MNACKALSYLENAKKLGSRPGLSRIISLLSLLGHPEKELSVIHVAGTNGKGSFCVMLSSVLTAAGYRVGMFTSPYLENVREQFRIDGIDITQEDYLSLLTEISGKAEQMIDPPTEFELYTALAYLYFQRNRVDYAVIECCMGGREDATNVMSSPLLSVITGISMDHTNYLGSTLSAIAFQKAGIIKKGRPVLFGGNCPEAENVIRQIASENGSPYFEKDASLLTDCIFSPSGTDFSFDGIRYHLPLLGGYQPSNAASVLTAISVLKNEGIVIPDGSVQKGFDDLRWKARFEKLCDSPAVYFDGGHNEEGIFAVVDTVKKYYGDTKLILISGVMRDKNYRKIAFEIARIADTVITVQPDNPRALEPEVYSSVYCNLGIASFPCRSFDEAVSAGYRLAESKNVPLLIVGSLYSYRQLTESLRRISVHNASGSR